LYWTDRVCEKQRRLSKITKVRTSRKLKRLHRIRQRSLRHAVNAMIKTIVEGTSKFGISKIVLGDLKWIREKKHNSKRYDKQLLVF